MCCEKLSSNKQKETLNVEKKSDGLTIFFGGGR
jgi:hypothetical protein